MHHGEVVKKVKARRTVSAPPPTANPKHHQLVMRSQANAPYASIPSRRRNTTNRKLISEFAVFPKTPKLRLQERYPVPTVHIEEEVVVDRTAIMVGTSRRESVTTPKDSDASQSTTPDNITTAIITNPPPNESVAASQPVSPHKPSNGTLGLISTVYGIEPVNKEMRTDGYNSLSLGAMPNQLFL
ncbi:transient receptor potential-gamma protein [Caerostris extrusa]|uniref:Transient receptor potential-gamma protein n=1 Tax=Caerostris extrusa TaxID=172846 RepID=A0AAV4TAU0_CAEEX|nr:transient receptor potential-gamma protein [Caerostris extrusa]